VSRVLIIEDDAQVRYLYEQAIRFQGIEVETASDGDEALEKLSDGEFTLVVLDLLLPQGNGFEFLQKMRQRVGEGKDIPIIIVTHLQDDAVKRQAMVLGVSAYLNKSEHSIGDIIREVRSHVDHA
jgi:CheY-like chemotaxis protein